MAIGIGVVQLAYLIAHYPEKIILDTASPIM